MSAISKITLTGPKVSKQNARELLAKQSLITHQKLERYADWISHVDRIPFSEIDGRLKDGENLSMTQAFVGMMYVLAATNAHIYTALHESISVNRGSPFDHDEALACGIAFLQALAVKESLTALTPEEIAGIALAANLDIIFEFSCQSVIETCGMGGDRGVVTSDSPLRKKTINASTLTSLTLASLGLPAIKHGSYGNTSKIGSTDAIEKFGAHITVSELETFYRIWRDVGFLYFDAHLSKTVHDLSHLLRVETINHVIGPMTPPISPTTKLYKLMGVNARVKPETMAEAFTLLSRFGKRKIGGVIVVAGLDESASQVILDELSPYTSKIALACGDRFLGSFTVKPSDFGCEIDPEKIFIPNDEKLILEANRSALTGSNESLADYLAMNSALGLYIMHYLSREGSITSTGLNTSMLKEAFAICKGAIRSGSPWEKLRSFVDHSCTLR